MSTAGLLLHWDTRQFLAKEYSYGPRHLSKVIVYCGVRDQAYATTTSDYPLSIWPNIAIDLLSCLQAVCEMEHGEYKSQIRGAEIVLAAQQQHLRAHLPGDATDMLAIAEALGEGRTGVGGVA